MTEVLHSPSPSSSSSSSCSLHTHHDPTLIQCLNQETAELGDANSGVTRREEDEEEEVRGRRERENQHLSLLALLLTIFRKSFWITSSCNTTAAEGQDLSGMEIGWPTDVQHITHVTFDRFNGFLGLPVEFEPEVPRRAPSASTTVFGVSTESMQLAYDSRGNSVPTILLRMQQRLYSQGGLQAEGIFRINAENSQEEHVRDQLNRGVVPDGIDVHCLAGLIKAWFRELPTGVLDPLSPEQVMQCQSEEDCCALVRLLPPTETGLLDWAINLMADVVQQEHLNKMNAHNIAMVFAPNMTQMADPLTALVYAVQVMNFLKTLITKNLRERENAAVQSCPAPQIEPSDENGHQGPPLHPHNQHTDDENERREQPFTTQDPAADDTTSDSTNRLNNPTDDEYLGSSTSAEESDRACFSDKPAQSQPIGTETRYDTDSARSSDSDRSLSTQVAEPKSRGISNLNSFGTQSEKVEAWR